MYKVVCQLVEGMYKCEWLWSVLLLNCNILFASDPTLNQENMLTSTDEVELPNEAKVSDYYLDMPHTTYNELVKRHGTGKEGKQQLFSEFLSHHPYPKWKIVVQLLQKLDRHWKARARLAQEVKDESLTSE